MGHRNSQFPSHFLHTEEDGQGHSGYGDVPLIRSFMPPSNRISFSESSLIHNTVLRPPQADIANLELSMGFSPSVQVHEQLSLSNGENFPQITSLLDNDPLKGKSFEIAEGPSSSADPLAYGPIQYDDARNSGPFVPYEHFETGPVEGEHSMGQEAVIPYSADPSPVPYQSSPWTNMQFGAGNGEVGSYLWPPPPPQFAYMNAHPNGAGVESGSITVLGQQLTPSSRRSSYGYVHPSPFVPYLPMQGYGIGYPSDASSSQSIPAGNSWNNVDSSYVFVSPIPAPFFQPHRREQLVPRHRNSPGPRVLREEDERDTNSSQETGSSDDQHNDMRMDIDDMSYEELLALEEAIGHVTTGLSEDLIRRNLKSRTVTLSEIGIDLENWPDQQILHLCTVCQNEYEVGDAVGSLDCGHEYHKACIEQWLVIKNTCPVCKATALSNQDQ